jgi:hypothetical protein
MHQSTLFFFSTRIGFASHLGCNTSLIKAADTRQANSTRIASLLSGRPLLRIHLELVLGQLSWNSQHVHRLPCKHVLVILEKLDKRPFLFTSEAGANDRNLALVEEPNVDPLGFFSQPHRGRGRCFVQGDGHPLLVCRCSMLEAPLRVQL